MPSLYETLIKWFGLMVFNSTFNDISVILWQSVLLVEEIGVPCEHHCAAASHWQTLSQNFVSSSYEMCSKWNNMCNCKLWKDLAFQSVKKIHFFQGSH